MSDQQQAPSGTFEGNPDSADASGAPTTPVSDTAEQGTPVDDQNVVDESKADEADESDPAESEEADADSDDKPEWNRETHGDPPAGREDQYNVI